MKIFRFYSAFSIQQNLYLTFRGLLKWRLRNRKFSFKYNISCEKWTWFLRKSRHFSKPLLNTGFLFISHFRFSVFVRFIDSNIFTIHFANQFKFSNSFLQVIRNPIQVSLVDSTSLRNLFLNPIQITFFCSTFFAI